MAFKSISYLSYVFEIISLQLSGHAMMMQHCIVPLWSLLKLADYKKTWSTHCYIYDIYIWTRIVCACSLRLFYTQEQVRYKNMIACWPLAFPLLGLGQNFAKLCEYLVSNSFAESIRKSIIFTHTCTKSVVTIFHKDLGQFCKSKTLKGTLLCVYVKDHCALCLISRTTVTSLSSPKDKRILYESYHLEIPF